MKETRDHWAELVEQHERALALPPEGREAFVAELARRAPELAAELREMLRNGGSTAFLHSPVQSTPAGPGLDGMVGRHLGRFEIQGAIGRGGMGVVFEAVQASPRRRVALKVLASPLASDILRRRFEVEAELLGRLRHPGIAQVFEAGVESFEGGFELPYLAMELVEGARHLPVYCDEEGLHLHARARLFVDVCRAVHAAHQNGVLHRDLKPSNLLVDGEGRVRVIDFGVARAWQEGPEHGPELTRTGELVGTPAYMSPEQCRGRSDEIDVRSDVWALGVVLYQLVAGTLPFDTEGSSATGLAAIHERAPAKLSRLVPGVPVDLDWIVAKALESDRARRYPSVSELSADLERWLAHEPVLATPPGRVYRARKFVRRNRLAVGAAVAISSALVAGTVLASVGVVRAREAEREARDDEQAARDEAAKFAGLSGVLANLLSSGRPELDGIEARAVDLLERGAETVERELADRPDVRKSLHAVLAESFRSLGSWQQALDQARAGLALARAEGPLDEASELDMAAVACSSAVALGELDRAGSWIDEALVDAGRAGLDRTEAAFELRRLRIELEMERAGGEEELAAALSDLRQLRLEVQGTLGAESVAAARVLRFLVDALVASSERQEAEQAAAELVELTTRLHGPDHLHALMARWTHAMAVAEVGRPEQARLQLEPVLPALRELAGDEHPSVLQALHDYGRLCLRCRRMDEAGAVLEVVVEARERLDGPDHPRTQHARSDLAGVQAERGQARAAEEVLRARLAALRKAIAADHPALRSTLLNLGTLLSRSGRYEEAIAVLEEASELRAKRPGDRAVDDAHVLETLGMAHFRQAEYVRAAEVLRPAYRAYHDELGPTHAETLLATNNLATCLGFLGEYDEAIELMEELVLRLEQTRSPADGRIVEAMISLGAIYGAAERELEAESVHRRAVKHAQEHLPVGHPLQHATIESFAAHLAEHGRHEEAVVLFEEAVRDLEQSEHVDYLQLGRYLQNYGAALAWVGEDEASAEALTESYRHLSSKLSAEHEEVQLLVLDLAALFERIGRDDEAARWRALHGR